MPLVLRMWTSCMRSATVCRRPSRLPTIALAPTALEPSVESMLPSPFWSKPRPPSGTLPIGTKVGLRMFSIPAAPPPWPTTLMAIVAIPCAARVEATTTSAPCLLSVKPWPKIATGQPAAGALPAGTKRLK